MVGALIAGCRGDVISAEGELRGGDINAPAAAQNASEDASRNAPQQGHQNADQDGSDAAAGDGGAGSATEAAAGISVPIAALSGSVPECGAGYAHPNVCCESPAALATQCTESLVTPFTPCDPTVALTFPDPRTCCSLDGKVSCVAADAGGGGGGTTASGCQLPCSVGLAPPSTEPNCALTHQLAGCTLCCTLDTCTLYGECSCPAEPADAAPCDCPGLASCNPCVAGWQAPGGVPDLCCRTTDAGATECFSQADFIGPLVPNPPVGDYTPTGCDLFARTSAGDSQEADCDSTRIPACTCTLDGVVVETLGTSPGCASSGPNPFAPTMQIATQNAEVAAVWAACGFGEPPEGN